MKKVLLSDRSLQLLFGPLDENIRFLENLFAVTIQARDSSLTIDGEEENVNALERILVDFSGLIDKGHNISNGDLKSAFKQIAEDAALTLHDFFPKMQLLAAGKRQVTPKSVNQRRYGEAIRQNDIVFARRMTRLLGLTESEARFLLGKNHEHRLNEILSDEEPVSEEKNSVQRALDLVFINYTEVRRKQ
jgi:phosphate starvation-inducible protein PhoH